MKSNIVDIADVHWAKMIRQRIHSHPELAFDEYRTSELIVGELVRMGYQVYKGIAKTGLVAVLKNGDSTRSIGIRADMDALPIQEINQFPHASKIPGKMHACGHDGHVAMLLCAARVLEKRRNFNGVVNLIFQPAEEGGAAGARKMIEEDLFDNFHIDAIFGMHNWPGLSVGNFAVAGGPIFASSNTFRVIFKGTGCHAAQPHMGTDVISASANFIAGVQSIVSRRIDPLDGAVLSITMLNAGSAINVLPDISELKGTVRALNDQVLSMVEERLRSFAASTAMAFDLSYEFDFDRRYPSLINSEEMSIFVENVLSEKFGREAVEVFPKTMGSEDFSYYLQRKPGCYFVIGNGDGEHRIGGHGFGPCSLHNSSYDFNDDLIPVGASAWVHIIEEFLK